MTTALKSALNEAQQLAQQLPDPLQDTMAQSILERVEQIKDAVAMMNLAATSMAEDWGNDLDAAYDNYEENHTLQTG